MKSYIFWDMNPCRSSKFNRSFRGIFRLHIQSQRINQARNQHETGSKQSSSFETSVDFRQTAWRYIPHSRILRYRRSENLKSDIGMTRQRWSMPFLIFSGKQDLTKATFCISTFRLKTRL
jgi:hypothetical protein